MASGKIPPHSIESEQSVLGAILIDKNAIVEVAGFLRAAHFYEEKHGVIYDAMLSLYEERRPIDLLTLTEKLKTLKKYKDVGESAYLTELTGAVPTSAHVEQYGKIIREMSAKRELIGAGGVITESAFDLGKSLQSVLDEAESKIFSISQENLARNFVSMKDVLAGSFDRLDEIQRLGGGMRGVPTGYKDLDNILAGMQASNLLVLAGRPGTGKTAFALNLVQHVAIKEKLQVGFFSLEMSSEELGDRLLVMESSIDSWRLKTGKLLDEDFDKLQEAMGVLADAPIYIDDTPGMSIMEMRTKARRLQMEKGLKLVVVDYLQLMDSGRHFDNRVQEVSLISQSLKNLARELRVPVVALSQLSRAVEQRGSKKPQLSDLRESGCLTAETLLMRADNGQPVSIGSQVGAPPFPVFALDEDYKLRVRIMTRVFSSGVKKVFKLTLRSGRQIRASANHPFKTLFSWKRLDELTIGERLAVPRAIPDQVLPADPLEDRLVLLAHMIGDGCYVQHQPIHYTSGSWVNILAVREAGQAEFGVPGKIVRQENWWNVYLTNKGDNPIIKWFRQMGIYGQHSFDKEIPSFIFSIPRIQLAYFLSHLWATDGNLSMGKKGKVSIYYASTSQRLIFQVQHLLLRLGIQGRVRRTQKKGYRGGFIVDISGKVEQLKFLQLVGVFGKKAQCLEIIEKLSSVAENPNVDVVPREVWKEVEEARKETGWSTRKFHQLMNWEYSGTQRFKNGVSRERLGHIADILPNDVLRNLSESDVFWDEVLEILHDGEEEVFDATVERSHNFLANDIVVHNSIEQDADVVMFLYRPDETKDMAPSDKMPIKLAIEKHRNGQAGIEIDFMFHGAKQQFKLMAK